MIIRTFALTLIAGFLIGAGPPAMAATIVVDTLDDSVDRRYCSIRSALEAARTDRPSAGCVAGDPGADTIRFARAGELELYTPLAISTSVTVEGSVRNRVALTGSIVTVEPGDDGRVGFSTLDFRTGLLVRSAAEVDIRGVRFLEIVAQTTPASAIQIEGPVVGRVRLSHSQFTANGGGYAPIFVAGVNLAELSIDNSRFQSNRGALAGAVYIGNQDPADVSIVATDFVGNSTDTGWSGAIVADGRVDLHLDGNSFIGNRGGSSGALSAVRVNSLSIVNSVFERNNGWRASAIWLRHFEAPSVPPELLFSTIVDNGNQTVPPALVNESSVPLRMRANLLRASSGGDACDYTSHWNWSLGYNIEIDGNSCNFQLGSDWPYAVMDLYRASLPGRSPVPAPDPASNLPAVDAVPAWDCADVHGRAVDTDLAGRSRPVEFAGGIPSSLCDVGAIELRPDDQLQPMP